MQNIQLANRLKEEYDSRQALFSAQPAIIQHFLEVQGKMIAEALLDGATHIRFSLPDRVLYSSGLQEEGAGATIPRDQRSHSAGNLLNRLGKRELYKELRHLLSALEQSPDRAVSAASGLVRHAAVMHMVHNMLPAGRNVTYMPADEDETIPSIPEEQGLEPESAITAETDAIVEEGKREEGRGDLLVPFVPYARRFYLPQWVAFDKHGEMLVNTPEEAEAHIKSMQRFMEVLFLAVTMAPYISADEEYANKRYGMLGELVNQGRALAAYRTEQIIARVRERASNGSLNRGLSLSLPYFDDQELRLDATKFEVIPAGRIMFVPAFVVRAVRQEQVKVSQDTRLSASTRKHLLYLLEQFERAFQRA